MEQPLGVMQAQGNQAWELARTVTGICGLRMWRRDTVIEATIKGKNYMPTMMRTAAMSISWNIRGLRGDGKLKMVKELKRKHRLDMLELVETKRQLVTRFDVLKIWGNGCAEWEYVESDGASGGLLLMWDDGFFKMRNCYKGERWLCVEGVLSEKSINCAFLLVYGAHTRDEKRVVWEELSYMAGLCPDACYRKFTWFRGQSCNRIDRALVSLEWLEAFPETRLRGGPRELSDHCPIIVEEKRLRDGPRPFRSLDYWFTHEGFLRMVKEEWRGLGEIQFTDKLKALTIPLGRWHRDNFGDMDRKILKFEEEIQKIDDIVGNGSYDETVEARRKALVKCCEKWYVRKELHWKQMSRSRHARDMDKNTRYFHNLASARRRNNRIDTLAINGRLIRNQARIKIAIREFYKELYHQERSPEVGFRDGLVERISEEDSCALEAPPSPEEIKEAVWDCESSKTPGCDGYNMNFIKKCWDDIGSDFTAAVMAFFQSSRLPPDANITWVALAPKFTGAKEIKDLRPISMVGCVYKVIPKMLVRRMREVMPGLVGETQSAFVKGRKIHDGALIACETVQWIKQRKKKRMIGEAVRNGRISPLMVGRYHIELSHLQFTDDTVLFCPPEEDTIKNYRRLLRCFQLMSGLSINFDKSSLIPVNCDEQWLQRMCGVLGCKQANLPVKYLGILLGANPRLVKTWKPVIDKVEEKLSLWKAKILNKAGKLVLIKSVLNSLPVYYLSLYKMPMAVAEKLISLQRRFLWSKEDGKNGMALVKWEVVQTPKKLGGLGVGDAVIRNSALLFKWWWRFSKEECPLWKKVVCSCNNLNPNELLSSQELPIRGGPWKDICQLQFKSQQVRQKMITGLSMEVGDGRRTRFWEDAWIHGGPLKDRFPRLFSVSNQTGSMIGDCGFWDGLDWVLQVEMAPEDIHSYSFTRTIWKGLVPLRE
ncbi:uncharacterized protein LOC130945580 [Arachis stenosperma]|uniref:uncharacterized protein LOC130945580 n=1 Tax=Arachis stenosperma TaxID=217475 RepID=UPI0025AD1D39|nr:uncharacterized protein LOC130945580 [Arachis stenosperma]